MSKADQELYSVGVFVYPERIGDVIYITRKVLMSGGRVAAKYVRSITGEWILNPEMEVPVGECLIPITQPKIFF